MMEVTISEETYNRLAVLATGFETPDAVINRLINSFHSVGDDAGERRKKPELFLYPKNESEFKEKILISKKARVQIYKKDGSLEEGVWNARSLTEKSSIRANIWSGYLRCWQKKGIVRAVFTVVII